MASMIHLAVGRLELDWGKGAAFGDHSQLYQLSDLTKVPYYYVDEDNRLKEDGEELEYNLVAELKDGLSKPLDQVMERVSLLGYTMNHARREFEHVSQMTGFDADKFSFEQLAESLATIDVESVSADYGEHERFGRFFRRCIFDKIGLERIVDDPEYVRFHAGEGMEHLSAYTILRLVAQNPRAQGFPVNWQFADIEEQGWAQRDEFVRPVDQENRFLIVTEGSSDAAILRHALSLLKPHVSDFFDFVDMDKGYPFTGTGNLYNFTKGLISISFQNNIIILYDNDAEGVFAFKRTVSLDVLKNMRILKLPDLPDFRDFRTIGPSGADRSDINGRAASIECYLGFGPEAAVRWKSYNKQLKVYQGELVGKRDVARTFLAQTKVSPDYDFSRVAAVVDMIISECTAIRESARLAELRES